VILPQWSALAVGPEILRSEEPMVSRSFDPQTCHSQDSLLLRTRVPENVCSADPGRNKYIRVSLEGAEGERVDASLT
jgi:hypothetical protein